MRAKNWPMPTVGVIWRGAVLYCNLQKEFQSKNNFQICKNYLLLCSFIMI
jgi:hypothetical protein